MKLTAGIKSSHKLESWITDQLNDNDMSFLQSAAHMGQANLSAATPRDTGGLASGWKSQVTKAGGVYTIRWNNTAYPNLSINLATALQYGHGTRNGGWVPGRDYINPAMRPVFDRVSDYYLRKGD